MICPSLPFRRGWQPSAPNAQPSIPFPNQQRRPWSCSTPPVSHSGFQAVCVPGTWPEAWLNDIAPASLCARGEAVCVCVVCTCSLPRTALSSSHSVRKVSDTSTRVHTECCPYRVPSSYYLTYILTFSTARCGDLEEAGAPHVPAGGDCPKQNAAPGPSHTRKRRPLLWQPQPLCTPPVHVCTLYSQPPEPIS